VHHDGTAAAAAAALVAHMQQRWWGVSCGGVGGAAMQTLGRRGCYGWKCSYCKVGRAVVTGFDCVLCG
jgi:hypothetical protein